MAVLPPSTHLQNTDPHHGVQRLQIWGSARRKEQLVSIWAKNIWHLWVHLEQPANARQGKRSPWEVEERSRIPGAAVTPLLLQAPDSTQQLVPACHQLPSLESWLCMQGSGTWLGVCDRNRSGLPLAALHAKSALHACDLQLQFPFLFLELN